MVISGHKLNGNNYLSCSKVMEMFITGKDKEDYLFCTVEPLTTHDPNTRVGKLSTE